MNYEMMKNLIDSLINNFSCPDCSSKVTWKNAEIMWAAGSAVNMDLVCPKCGKHTMVRAELSSLWQINWMDKLKEQLEQQLNVKLNKASAKKAKTINDKNIVDLNNVLKQENINVDDLLKP